MRLFALLFLLVGLISGPAFADQTDARLPALFEELRRSTALDAPAIELEISGIWAEPQSGTVAVLTRRALESLEAEDWALAEALMDHAIGVAPSFAEAYALRGFARLRNSDSSGAALDFERAVELEPRHFRARAALSALLLASGELERAFEMAQAALSWNPHDETALQLSRKLHRRIEGQEI